LRLVLKTSRSIIRVFVNKNRQNIYNITKRTNKWGKGLEFKVHRVWSDLLIE